MPAGLAHIHAAHAAAAQAALMQPELAAGLTRIVYRSRASVPLATHDLHGMIRAAQGRNAVEGISGLVVYDRARFYQWIEGPTESVQRVLHSINQDERHTDIRMVAQHAVGTRLFDGWDMRLAGDMQDGAAGRVLHMPAGEMAALRGSPDTAEDVLASLAPRRSRRGRKPESQVARILRQVILTRVIPELADRHRPGGGAAHPLAMVLARLLAAGDSRGAAELMSGAMRAPGELVTLLARLAEPAARLLGDFWADDEIEELDVTLGLCCLRTAVRQTALLAPPALPAAWAPHVLSASHPGEPHALGPALHPEAMWQAGWSPRIATPERVDGLLEMVASERFDCLDLSLSAAFARREQLASVAETIARARRASRNPALAVVVSGRAAAGDAAARVGADAAVPSALHVLGAVRRAVALRAAA